MPRTLTTVVSKSAGCFDSSGLIQPLTTQTKLAISEIIQEQGKMDFNQKVDYELFQHWLSSYYEWLLGSQATFQRKTEASQCTGINMYLVGKSDYCPQCSNICIYLVYETLDGKNNTTHLLGSSCILKSSVAIHI